MAVATTAPSVQAPSHATFSTEGVRAHGDAPLDHGPSPATETRDPNSAVTPCRGSNPAMGARAPTAAPLNHYTGPCTSHAPPRHTSRNKNAAATTRRLLTRAGSSPFLPVRKAAVDLRCGKGNLITAIFFSRCDPVSPRESSGRSILSPIEEKPTSLAISSPTSKSANGNDPPRSKKFFLNCPCPALEDAHRIYGPSSVFRHSNSRPPSYVRPSGAELRSDTPQLASSDATASSPISWTLFP